LRESLLHFIREFVVGRVDCRHRHVQRTIPDEDQASASTSPTINHPSPQDRSQPRSLATPAFKILPALPRTAQCLLHDILRIVTIAYQPVRDPIQSRSMFVDQDDKVCPRKRHPLPLSVSLFRKRWPVALAVTHCITSRAISDRFAWQRMAYSRLVKNFFREPAVGIGFWLLISSRCRKIKREIELECVVALEIAFIPSRRLVVDRPTAKPSAWSLSPNLKWFVSTVPTAAAPATTSRVASSGGFCS
jgi:hypothetical protein